MKTSLLTQSIKSSDYQNAVHQLQQLNRPAQNAEQICDITLFYQSKPSQKYDGKDWAREVLQNQNKHNQLAIKWAREVLRDEK